MLAPLLSVCSIVWSLLLFVAPAESFLLLTFKPLSVMSGRPLYRPFHPAMPCFENEAPAEGAAPAQGEEKPIEATLDDQLASIKKQLESSEKEVFSFYSS